MFDIVLAEKDAVRECHTAILWKYLQPASQEHEVQYAANEMDEKIRRYQPKTALKNFGKISITTTSAKESFKRSKIDLCGFMKPH